MQAFRESCQNIVESEEKRQAVDQKPGRSQICDVSLPIIVPSNRHDYAVQNKPDRSRRWPAK
jgi:hypothetical protein